MKRFGLSLTFASATLFLAVPLHAQDGAGAPMTSPMAGVMSAAPSPQGMRGTDMLKRFDKNADGRIDDDERADAKEMMLKEQLDRQMARVTASQATPEQLRQRALEFFDGNRDGRLDEDERGVLQKFVENRAAPTTDPARAAWREEFLRRVDRNANGRLDPDEAGAVRDYLLQAQGVPSAPPERNSTDLERFVRTAIEANGEQRQRFDRNSDGRLDDQEWAAARGHIRHILMDEVNDANEQRRLNAVAAEVARRRAIREKANEQGQAKK